MMKHMERITDVCENTCKYVLEKQESILRDNQNGEHLSSQELDDLKDCMKILCMAKSMLEPATK